MTIALGNQNHVHQITHLTTNKEIFSTGILPKNFSFIFSIQLQELGTKVLNPKTVSIPSSSWPESVTAWLS